MRQPPILMYHWFRRSSELSQSRSPQFEITPELFERQMTCLRRRGYESVSLSEMFGGKALPKKPIVITFDDGTLDFWEFGRPILQACGFTATLFVVTQYVGTESSWEADVGEPARRLMDWDQLRALAAAGLWYDALEQLSDSVDAAPSSAGARSRRNALLTQVGLVSPAP